MFNLKEDKNKIFKKVIIGIGPTTQNNTEFNGQSMMFQLFVDNFPHQNFKLITLDIGKTIFKKNRINRVSGKISIFKVFDYSILLVRFFFILINNKKPTIYLTTAQSKVGFIRDFFFINLAYFFGCKIITHQFGANYGKFYASQAKAFKGTIIKTLTKINTIIVEGGFVKAQFAFLPNFKTKVHVLPNALPQKINSSKIYAKEISEGPLNLLYLSNLIESKGYWDVLEAINILVNTNNINVNAVFVGKFMSSLDDFKFNNTTEAASTFFRECNENVKRNVTYFESLYGTEKEKIWDKSNFFILPSYYINEGQPVSIIEALAHGCVPIVTNYRLISTMVNSENGFFVNPQSPQEIADIILKLLNNPAKYKRYSQAGINYYLKNFTPEKYITQLIDLIN